MTELDLAVIRFKIIKRTTSSEREEAVSKDLKKILKNLDLEKKVEVVEVVKTTSNGNVYRVKEKVKNHLR